MAFNDKLYNEKKKHIKSIKQKRLSFFIIYPEDESIMHYERHRSSGRRQYDPTSAEKERHRKLILEFLAKNYPNFSLIKTSCRIEYTFATKVPTTWSQVDRRLALEGYIKPFTKPDIDNYEKIYNDLLTNCVTDDDAIIYGCTSECRFSKYNYVKITLTYDSKFRTTKQEESYNNKLKNRIKKQQKKEEAKKKGSKTKCKKK